MAKAVKVARSNFNGRITYGAASELEQIDWRLFDIVGLDYYSYHQDRAGHTEDRKLLERYLCPTDRRGIYTEVTEAGRALLAEAEPTHDEVLTGALRKAAEFPELAPLVDALAQLPLPAKV